MLTIQIIKEHGTSIGVYGCNIYLYMVDQRYLAPKSFNGDMSVFNLVEWNMKVRKRDWDMPIC